MPEVKKFTYAEVKKHNTAEDVWLVINDKVYDVTKFLKEVCSMWDVPRKIMNKILINFFFYTNQHPGGDEVLIEAAGKNGKIWIILVLFILKWCNVTKEIAYINYSNKGF